MLSTDVFFHLDAGAIEAVGSSNLVVLNSTFSSNGGLNAGSIAVKKSSIFVNGLTFEYNKGPQIGSFLFILRCPSMEPADQTSMMCSQKLKLMRYDPMYPFFT